MKRKHGLSIAERLERTRVVRGECWETCLSPSKRYPQIKVGGRHVTSHRLAYETYVGPIPEGMSVLHSCDNPRCHRPEHLFLGTASDNMQDMWNKGRHPRIKSRLDTEQIILLAETKTQKQVAVIFGVSQTAISSILRKANKGRGRGTAFRTQHK